MAKIIEINTLNGGRAGTRTPGLLRVKPPIKHYRDENKGRCRILRFVNSALSARIEHDSEHNSLNGPFLPEAA